MAEGAPRRPRSKRRIECQEYLAPTLRVQQELRDDVDVLQEQEGWDVTTRRGVADWIRDTPSIWRALRRNRYDEDKALSFLLDTLHQRISLSLHDPVPSTSIAQSPLFVCLPPDRFMDRTERPIAVLTLREVRRDAEGKLDELKDWVWWALEMGRRMLRDSTADGTGFVLLVDANGAGYRNMEVELLPTVLSVGHNNFPGLFEAIYVVNSGWTHRSMWKVVKRVLPRSALEKIAFLDSQQEAEVVFDLDKLPESYGGRVSWECNPNTNLVWKRYSLMSPIDSGSKPSSPTSQRTVSVHSRSRRPSLALRIPRSSLGASEDDGPATVPSETPLQRIKSLSNFHLYLSPSRLANIDLLSDSENEEDARVIVARRSKAPVVKRPPLDPTYSSRLQEHHAKGLQQYVGEAPPTPEGQTGSEEVSSTPLRDGVRHDEASRTGRNLEASVETNISSNDPNVEPISAFSQEANPWFGYPAVRVSAYGSSSIRPRYVRNRRRDLVKTLIFLFLLRIQSWRDGFERMMGLGRRSTARDHVGPSEGLMRQAGRRDVSTRVFEKDWTWMLVGFLIFRASWTRLLAAPLEAMGLESIKDMLGIA